MVVAAPAEPGPEPVHSFAEGHKPLARELLGDELKGCWSSPSARRPEDTSMKAISRTRGPRSGTAR